MLVSIIVPIYNVQSYLRRCLDSIAGQSYLDIEVVGVDDCSKDQSKDIFYEYKGWNANFRLIEHRLNKGLPGARNTGIVDARGDYLLFVDSDDWLAPDAVEKLVALAEADSVEIAIGGVAKYYDKDCRLEVPLNHGRCMADCKNNVQIDKHPVLFNSVTSWNKLIRRDFLVNNNLYFLESPRRYEDMLTYMWYLSGATVSNISDVTYYYRQRHGEEEGASIMQELSPDSLIDKLKAFYNILRFSVDQGVFGTELDPLSSKYAMMNLKIAMKWIAPSFFEMCNLYGSRNEVSSPRLKFFRGWSVMCDIFELLPLAYCKSDEYMVELKEAMCLDDTNLLLDHLREIRFGS